MMQHKRCSMFWLSVVWVAMVVVILLSTNYCSASQCRVVQRTAVVAQQQQYIVTAYAVPVAVPVAPYASYWYSSNQYMNYAPTQPAAPSNQDPAYPDPYPQEDARASEVYDANLSLFQAKCTRCHGGKNPKHDLDLADPLQVDPLQKLKAIQAIQSGKMPKGGRLTQAERNALIEVLTREPAPAPTEN